MKRIHSILFLAFLLACANVFSQAPQISSLEDKSASVKLSASKTSGFQVGDVVTLRFKTKVVESGWHLYSSSQKKGDDGSEIAYRPTEFFLFDDKCKGIELKGGMSENVKPKSEYDDLMEGTIRKFKESDEVTFSQKIKITAEDFVLSGEFVYQICQDDGMCKFPNAVVDWSGKASPKPVVEEKPVENTVEEKPENGVGGSNDTNGSGGDTEGNEGVDTAAVASDTSGTTDSVQQAATPVVEPNGQGSAEAGSGGASVQEEPADCSPGSLWGIFIQAFLGGFVAFLTPCVFPMVPITVNFFLKQSKTRSQGIFNALVYGISIVLIYVVIGILITAIFGGGALHQISTNPWLNIAFFLIFFAFALSFLGMFEIKLPSKWSTKTDSQADRGGMIGIFFMALTLAIASFSCTGPIMGTILANVQGTCIWNPIMGMLGFGLALAIPFALFALFPSWLNSMPRSGGWMNSVKVVMGFLELALALKFLSGVDQAWHWGLLDRQVFAGIWIVIFVLLGVYLLGKITLPHDSKIERLSVPRLLLAIVSFSVAMYILPVMWGANAPAFEGLLPPQNNETGVKLLPNQVPEIDYGMLQGSGGNANGEKPLPMLIQQRKRKYSARFSKTDGAHHILPFYDLDDALAAAKEWKKPIFLDFTGHFCANCRKVETQVWPDNEVHRMMKHEYIVVSLYSDDRGALDEPAKLPDGTIVNRIDQKAKGYQEQRYHTITQPYYAVLDFNEKDLLDYQMSYSDAINPENFREYLRKGLEEFEKRHGGE